MEIANERYAGESPLSESPNEAVSLIIGDNTVSTPKLQDNAVTTEKINDKAVTPEKLSVRVTNEIIQPAINQAKNELNSSIQQLAAKEERDINNVTQDYGNKINALSGSVTNQINTLRQDCTRKYNILDRKIDNSVSALTNQFDGKLDVLDNKQTKRSDDLQKQITNNLKQYNKQRSTDLKSIKDQFSTFRDKDRDLQNQIDSIQIGGWAISQMFGQDIHIGISQNTLTNVIGRLWEVLGEIKGKNYMDFTLTVEPEIAYNEGTAQVNIIADCTDTISYFDSVKIYVNDVLVDEAEGVNLLSTVVEIDDTSIVKAVGIIVGKTIIKEKTVIQEDPFFIGSAPENYQDVMIQDNWHEIQGTLEGDYNFTVNNDGDHIFVIIPISRREEFRRCKLDMNGFEIPFDVTETSDLIICKSQNTYVHGDYNLDIDINS